MAISSSSNYGLFRHGVGRGVFWFRVLGYGVHVADKCINPPMFSERSGIVKVYRFGKWGVKFLRR